MRGFVPMCGLYRCGGNCIDEGANSSNDCIDVEDEIKRNVLMRRLVLNR